MKKVVKGLSMVIDGISSSVRVVLAYIAIVLMFIGLNTFEILYLAFGTPFVALIKYIKDRRLRYSARLIDAMDNARTMYINILKKTM